MELLPTHYAQLLGLESPWEVANVTLDLESNQVDIQVEYNSKSGFCPDCSSVCPLYDHSPKRSWRHLDTMQFKTLLHSKSPRIKCEKHGIKTIPLPWARKNSGFTLLFEAFAVTVLNASKSTEDARKLLGVNWHQLQKIMVTIQVLEPKKK
jgi:transposase